MQPRDYLDPTWGQETWNAIIHCPDCGEETEHDFVRKDHITTAWCLECDFEQDVELDD